MKELHVLLYQAKDGGWVARGLEHDIMAQGDSIREAKKEFRFALKAEKEFLRLHDKSLDCVPRAPQEFWNRYDKAKAPLFIFFLDIMKSVLYRALILILPKNPVADPPPFSFTRESKPAY